MTETPPLWLSARHIVSFHVPFTAAQFLAQAVQAQMPVRYFRDITASTRRLFVRD